MNKGIGFQEHPVSSFFSSNHNADQLKLIISQTGWIFTKFQWDVKI